MCHIDRYCTARTSPITMYFALFPHWKAQNRHISTPTWLVSIAPTHRCCAHAPRAPCPPRPSQLLLFRVS
ncbi:hypothetical protein VTO73DRAFT_484 [Trametes versicolor]